ncbi:MAG: phytanoyl-CoA dioxygenase family protein [Proteobacteria bacterium]|nr:phytanoyl-CoA dioxygenase family protein [Pseudomonadota bacterium]
MSQESINIPLNNTELENWHQNGFLLLKNILKEDETKKLLNIVDRIILKHHSEKLKEKNTKFAHGKEYFNIHNPFDYTKQLDYLLDHPKTFDIVTYLMGPYIQAMSCHIFVRHPSSSVTTNIGKFHTDSGPALQRILPTRENLPLQLKVQFFLTDINTDNASNFIAIPGSHIKRVTYHHPYCLIPECNKYIEQGQLPPDAVQIKAKAGDVLIHSLSLWHAVASNKSPNTRRSISIRYGQMWFKDYYFKITKHILKRMTPRQRRLLGDFGNNVRGDVAYRPPDDHVPLMLGEKAAAYGWSLDWMQNKSINEGYL